MVCAAGRGEEARARESLWLQVAPSIHYLARLAGFRERRLASRPRKGGRAEPRIRLEWIGRAKLCQLYAIENLIGGHQSIELESAQRAERKVVCKFGPLTVEVLAQGSQTSERRELAPNRA